MIIFWIFWLFCIIWNFIIINQKYYEAISFDKCFDVVFLTVFFSPLLLIWNLIKYYPQLKRKKKNIYTWEFEWGDYVQTENGKWIWVNWNEVILEWDERATDCYEIQPLFNTELREELQLLKESDEIAKKATILRNKANEMMSKKKLTFIKK